MSQRTAILNALRAGRKLTPVEALRDFGCFRLGARIHELKQAGHDIRSRRIEVGEGKRVAQYSMAEKV